MKIFVAIFLCAALWAAVDAQVYSYGINVQFSQTSKFDSSQDGKLKLSVYSGNTRYQVALSAVTETFRRSDIKSYAIAAPLNIQQIDKVALSWTRQKKISDPKGWFVDPKIYVDKITVDPVYIQHYALRQQSVKSFCGNKFDISIKPTHEEYFNRYC